jgi:hypothetical protein
MLFPAIAKLSGASEATMNSLFWKVPLCTFASVGIVRLFLSPFFVWKKIHDENKLLSERIAPKFIVTDYAFRRAPATFMPMKQPVGSVTRMNFPAPAALISSARMHIQLLPKCLTAAPVLRCRAHLIRTFSKTPESQWAETAMNESSSLKWSLCDDTEITLEPGAERRLSVCYADSNSQLLPDIDTLPARVAHDFKMLNTFSFDVKIAADNCAPVYVCLEVSRQTEWDNPSCIVRQGLTLDQTPKELRESV